MAVPDHVQPDQHREREHQLADEADRFTGVRTGAAGALVEVLFFVVALLLTKHDGDAGHCREEDDLLAHRVDPAVVERDRADGLGDVPFTGDGGVDHIAVRALVMPVSRQPEHAPQHQQREAGGADGEDDQTGPVRHS